MKRLSLLLFVVVMFCALPLHSKVRVLSVCVGNYPGESGWNHLGSANDGKAFKTLFPELVSLNDSEATFQTFSNELGKLAKTTEAGDTVIVHFSGHGQQILTPESSSEADHVDEAMVPFDAAKRETASYHGQNHFTDDSFGKYITAIRKKIGPEGLVIAVIDACHSNSMDKDADDSGDTYRGTDEIFGAESLSPDSISALRDYYYAIDSSSVQVAENLADVIFIGACETHQRNYEIKKDGEQFGSLSYYFCKVYREKGLSDINDFLLSLHTEMSDDNTLKFHGQRPSIRTSFGWEAPKVEKYIPQTANPEVLASNSNKFWIWIASGVGALFAALLSTFIFGLWKRKK